LHAFSDASDEAKFAQLEHFGENLLW
jgi:hypothetical protein